MADVSVMHKLRIPFPCTPHSGKKPISMSYMSWEVFMYPPPHKKFPKTPKGSLTKANRNWSSQPRDETHLIPLIPPGKDKIKYHNLGNPPDEKKKQKTKTPNVLTISMSSMSWAVVMYPSPYKKIPKDSRTKTRRHRSSQPRDETHLIPQGKDKIMGGCHGASGCHSVWSGRPVVLLQEGRVRAVFCGDNKQTSRSRLSGSQ
ncbi:hypothetical protein EGW08_017339 [Elysia chlorotica]|uniref:Uncharacterized protein n=1 Tax=Elysia chlorotica TaxID=188477 RepID=A0A433T026_ELYCH|nr:hypothetical protein EGW08_017339 [Elysia chlorotica]